MASVKTVNCGVSDNGSELIFKLTAELATHSITFRIEPASDGKEVGVLEIKKDGDLVRKYTSKPFPAGSLVYNETSSGKEKVGSAHIFRVKLDKKRTIDLYTYFE